jgi:formamidase
LKTPASCIGRRTDIGSCGTLRHAEAASRRSAGRREQAYIICSVAVDLRISNVVDVPNYVVSALLPEAIFDGD